jgi:hypothetical protein
VRKPAALVPELQQELEKELAQRDGSVTPATKGRGTPPS